MWIKTSNVKSVYIVRINKESKMLYVLCCFPQSQPARLKAIFNVMRSSRQYKIDIVAR